MNINILGSEWTIIERPEAEDKVGSAFDPYNYKDNVWADEAYRTIHIRDGAMTGDIETFRWLFKNGVFNPAD